MFVVVCKSLEHICEFLITKLMSTKLQITKTTTNYSKNNGKIHSTEKVHRQMRFVWQQTKTTKNIEKVFNLYFKIGRDCLRMFWLPKTNQQTQSLINANKNKKKQKICDFEQ